MKKHDRLMSINIFEKLREEKYRNMLKRVEVLAVAKRDCHPIGAVGRGYTPHPTILEGDILSIDMRGSCSFIRRGEVQLREKVGRYMADDFVFFEKRSEYRVIGEIDLLEHYCQGDGPNDML